MLALADIATLSPPRRGHLWKAVWKRSKPGGHPEYARRPITLNPILGSPNSLQANELECLQKVTRANHGCWSAGRDFHFSTDDASVARHGLLDRAHRRAKRTLQSPKLRGAIIHAAALSLSKDPRVNISPRRPWRASGRTMARTLAVDPDGDFPNVAAILSDGAIRREFAGPS